MEQQQLKNFKQLIKTKGRSDRTIKTYEYWINQLLSYANKQPEDITKRDIDDFINNKRETVCVDSTIVMRSAFKLFFKQYLGMKELFDDGIPIKTTHKNKIITVLKKPEIFILLNGVNGNNSVRDKLAIILGFDGACRVSDMQKIEHKNIKKNGNILIRSGKGGKDRITTWELKKTWTLLQEYLSIYNPKKYLFEKKNGETYHTDTFQDMLRKAGSNSELNRTSWGWHILRHSRAVYWSKNKVPIEIIAERLGHASLNTTILYLRGKLKDI